MGYYRDRDEVVKTHVEIFDNLLPAIRTVCGGLLGKFPHPPGCGAGQDGHVDHLVPGADQHLQHDHCQLSQCRGDDCHRRLDAGLYLLCLRCSCRLCLSSLEEEEKLSQEQEAKKGV